MARGIGVIYARRRKAAGRKEWTKEWRMKNKHKLKLYRERGMKRKKERDTIIKNNPLDVVVGLITDNKEVANAIVLNGILLDKQLERRGIQK